MMSSSAVGRFGFAQVVVTTVLVLGSMAVLAAILFRNVAPGVAIHLFDEESLTGYFGFNVTVCRA